VHALTIALLAAALLFYLWGVSNLWSKAGRGRGLEIGNIVCFAFGWFTVAVALLTPLHHWAERLLWVHMVQHELLMVVAAPLLVLGRPVEAWSWVVPLRVPRFLADPVLAWALHAIAIWVWHAPVLFQAAAQNEWLHLAQHTSFFLPAAIFWWSVFGTRQLGTVLSLFTTMLHTGALGALMTLSRTPWYAGYGLEDQQLAGLIMWIPAASAYPLAALWLISRSLRHPGDPEASRSASSSLF
jgi:putative membrane protein